MPSLTDVMGNVNIRDRWWKLSRFFWVQEIQWETFLNWLRLKNVFFFTYAIPNITQSFGSYF